MRTSSGSAPLTRATDLKHCLNSRSEFLLRFPQARACARASPAWTSIARVPRAPLHPSPVEELRRLPRARPPRHPSACPSAQSSYKPSPAEPAAGENQIALPLQGIPDPALDEQLSRESPSWFLWRYCFSHSTASPNSAPAWIEKSSKSFRTAALRTRPTHR